RQPRLRSAAVEAAAHAYESTRMFDMELECARAAADAAGAAVLAHYGTSVSEIKAGGTPVTAADHASSDAIIARIHAQFPDDAILCEETVDSEARLAARRIWIVDPLDGT